MGKTEAVLDSDFIQGLLKWGTKDFFKQLMDELDVTPFVHPYVAEVELQYCIEAKEVAKYYINSQQYTLEVKNITELLYEIGSSDNALKWRDVKNVLSENRWKKDKEKLWHLWNE